MTHTTPTRIQRKRSHGWRMPDGIRDVGRMTRWGNPFAVVRDDKPPTVMAFGKVHYAADSVSDARRKAVELYREYAEERLRRDPTWLDPLRDATALACWCALDEPCHANVLIELLQEME